MKGKPFLIAALVFGGLGIIMLILTAISFFCGDNLISYAIARALLLDSSSFSDATMGQMAVVLFIPSFIFAFRSFADADGSDHREQGTESSPEPAAVNSEQ